jgi:hypothetical protein
MPEYLRKAMSRLEPSGMTRILRMFDVIQSPEFGRLSEDVSFCHRVRDAGFEIWANVRHKIDHIGSFNYHLRYEGIMEQQAKAADEAAKTASKIMQLNNIPEQLAKAADEAATKAAELPIA